MTTPQFYFWYKSQNHKSQNARSSLSLDIGNWRKIGGGGVGGNFLLQFATLPKRFCSTVKDNIICINIHGQKEKGMHGSYKCPPKDIHVSIPGTCEHHLIWQGLHQCCKLEDLEMRKWSCIIWMNPTLSPVSLKEGGQGRLTPEEKVRWGWEQTLKWHVLKMEHKPRNAGRH